jgi:peptide/nickel transport system permease protein
MRTAAGNVSGYNFNLILGAALVGALAFGAAFAPWLAPHGQADLIGDVWAGPSWAAPLGTDALGRDMLSRLLYGGRASIGIALIATIIGFAIGVTVGFTAACLPALAGDVISRLNDTLMAMPQLIVALVVLSVLGTSFPVLIGTMALLDCTRVYRLSRALAGEIFVREFVECARLRGESMVWVMTREILPNVWRSLVSEFGIRFCFAVLFISSLSFLGLGIQPPYADWGSMVRENAPALVFGGTAFLVPSVAIAALAVGTNLLVDALLAKRKL